MKETIKELLKAVALVNYCMFRFVIGAAGIIYMSSLHQPSTELSLCLTIGLVMFILYPLFH